MKNIIELGGCIGFEEMSGTELSGIYGGDYFLCDPSNCFFAYAANMIVSFVVDNIEHPIGAAAGYPPK